MIYLDNAASTPVCRESIDSMMPFFDELYANSASIHTLGKKVEDKIESVRELVAKELNVLKNEVYFTSCATESNNWVVYSLAAKRKDLSKQIISSIVNHSSVVEPLVYLENQGFNVITLDINKQGFTDISYLEDYLKKGCAFITISFASSEIGTLQPIEHIAKLAKKYNTPLHIDFVQGFLKYKIDPKKLGIDFLSISSHKVFGPKGAAVLFVNKDIEIDSFIKGGSQERNMRSGTLNSQSIVGFGGAIDFFTKNREKIIKTQKEYTDTIYKKCKSEIPSLILNGDLENRLNNHLSFSIPKIKHQQLFAMLDLKGICVSTGSACNSNDVKKSKLLTSLHKKNNYNNIDGAIRITCSYKNTKQEIDLFTEIFVECVNKLT